MREPEASGTIGLGLSIASHSGLPPSRIGALAEAAEQAGFSAVFVAEGHGDALTLCHPAAAATRRARVRTAVANAALRPPVLAAKTAAQLDQAANGGFILGLGSSMAAWTCGACASSSWLATGPVRPIRCHSRWPTGSWRMAASRRVPPG